MLGLTMECAAKGCVIAAPEHAMDIITKTNIKQYSEYTLFGRLGYRPETGKAAKI